MEWEKSHLTQHSYSNPLRLIVERTFSGSSSSRGRCVIHLALRRSFVTQVVSTALGEIEFHRHRRVNLENSQNKLIISARGILYPRTMSATHIKLPALTVVVVWAVCLVWFIEMRNLIKWLIEILSSLALWLGYVQFYSFLSSSFGL
jgi:hypothetical protein